MTKFDESNCKPGMVKYAKYLGPKAGWNTVREVVVTRHCKQLKTFHGVISSLGDKKVNWHETGLASWFWGRVHHTKKDCEKMV